MRYQFYGKKIPFYGKTLWEIVGNLKNFGVGRLVKKTSWDKFPNRSFYKIIKVQVLPPSKQPVHFSGKELANDKFEERFVKAWVEEIHRGVNKGIRAIAFTKYPKYSLIPKIEEEKYYKACEEVSEEEKKKYLCKYCEWPLLYKLLWEKTAQKSYGPLPNLNAVTANYPGFEVIKEEKYYKPKGCSLNKSELSVEEMYKEIVYLKKLIKANSEASNQET